MALFGGAETYDRTRILDEAARARTRKRRKRAIELYRWALAVEPTNGELHAKLAPLLAETGQRFDAWTSYKATARACLREGRTETALAVFREATTKLPREEHAWEAVARLHHRRGEDAEAVDALLRGSRNFRSRGLRPRAIHLLRRARTLDPWSFEVVMELSRHLARSHQAREARLLLEGLAQRCGGSRLRRVRGAQLRLDPRPVTAWRWLRVALGPTVEEPAAPPPQRRSPVVPIRSARAR
jgi:tetratricopeptide (TPR) repeat protein